MQTPAYEISHSNLCKMVELFSRCDIAAGGAVSATSSTPLQIGTWTLAGTGRYLLTLSSDLGGAVNTDQVYVFPTLFSATAQDITLQVSILTATTIEVRTLTGATATAPAAACKIFLKIALSNSTVT